MELKEILESERTKEARKGFNIAFQTYLTNREKALEGIDEESLKKELIRIKKESIRNLNALKAKAIENLRKQGVQVFEAKDSKDRKSVV